MNHWHCHCLSRAAGCRIRFNAPFAGFQPTDYYVAVSDANYSTLASMCHRESEYFDVGLHVTNVFPGGGNVSLEADFLVFAGAAP